MAIGQPPQPNTGQSKEKKLSPEARNQEIKDTVLRITEAALDLPDEELNNFQNEIVKRVSYLRGKYPDAQSRKVLHVLMNSDTDTPDIVEEDFPGDDSVEKFVDYLAKKYAR